jgi:hypothetical protein
MVDKHGRAAGLSLVRGMRRSLTEDEQGNVVEHLESRNWKIEHGPPREVMARI